MPPVVNAKPSRTSSIYGSRKRSVSPTSSASASSSQSHFTRPKALPQSQRSQPRPIMSTSLAPIRRSDDSTYFEEDYQEDIVEYMHYMDNHSLASAELMDMQPELQWFMRPFLIDFLVEVHQQFRLRPEVLFLAMNIVDRYVSKRVVYKKHYQLVGCAALWIASKFEDGKDKVPLVKELSDMCCKAYDESAFIQMEGHVLSTIGWTIGHPSAEAWLRLATTGANQEELRIGHVARFVMEVTLFHREYVGIQSHLVAAGALMLARFICGKVRKPAPPRLEHVTVRIAMAIDRHFGEKLESISEIVIRKYSPTYYSKASTITREWYLSGRRFTYNPEAPVTPVAINVPTPGLAPSGSWSSKRGSWMSGSPSLGSMSCSSSDAGDESPITPITPIHAHVVDPFSVASKENIAPGEYTAAGNGLMVKDSQTKQITPFNQNHGASQMYGHQRAVLQALPPVGELALPSRPLRRLSN